ncbi:MAG: urease accessory protein UreD [Chamaesiphon sp.]
MVVINISEQNIISQSSWHGSLNLEFAHRYGGTQLIHNQVQAPLRVQRPFYPEGSDICHIATLHTAGGIVGGDRLTMDFRLEPKTHVLITSAAAGKVYRSSGIEAGQTVRIQVAESACLEWLPQETIIFNGAIYRQDVRVELATHATWLGWEITRFGRSARGEQFLQGNWRSNTEVWRQNCPLWIERQWLKGGEEMVNSPHGLAMCPVVGSFALVGRVVSTDIVEKARILMPSVDRQGEAGVTTLLEGMLCRYRGFSTRDARSWFTQVWQIFRLAYLERAACIPRVWQI